MENLPTSKTKSVSDFTNWFYRYAALIKVLLIGRFSINTNYYNLDYMGEKLPIHYFNRIISQIAALGEIQRAKLHQITGYWVS